MIRTPKGALPVPKKQQERLKDESFQSLKNGPLEEAHKWVLNKLLTDEYISNQDVWDILIRLKITKRNTGAPRYYLTGLSQFLVRNHQCKILSVFKEKSPASSVKTDTTKYYYGLFLC